MSIEAMQAVFRIPGEKLNGSSRMVLAVLAFHHNRDTGKLCPSQQTIAREAGISRMHLTRVLRSLTESGFLDRRSGKAAGQVNHYRISLITEALSQQGGATSMLQGGVTPMLQGVQPGCCTEPNRNKIREEKIVRVRSAHTESASRNYLKPISGGKKEEPTPPYPLPPESAHRR